MIFNCCLVRKNPSFEFIYPFADVALPADDGRLQPAMRLDVCVAENGASLDAHAVLDDHVGADDHVRSDAAVFADLG